MKKFLLVGVMLASVALSGCAGPITRSDNTVVKPYGIFNEDSRKVPGVKYEVSLGSVVVAIIFSETIIIPVYVVGWDLFQPIK